MSDLCYNCGDCHLPKPCTQNLKHCDICDNLGHTYNFCPLSVRNKDPTYQFWALCHNCDRWHLPDPCETPLHRCQVCGHNGHKEFFCPIKPVPRGPPSGQAAGVKRQRTNGSDMSEAEHVTPEMVQKIKTDTAINIFAMLNRNYSHEDIMRHIAPNMLHTVANRTTYNMDAQDSQNDSVLNTPTPTPAQVHTTRTGSAPGLYSIMQDRFARGDLKEPHAGVVAAAAQAYARDYGNQYMENGQNQVNVNGFRCADSTPNQARPKVSHYAESFHASNGNIQGSGDNINVGAATALQELAQNAVTRAATPSRSFVAPASSNINGAVSQSHNFKETIENAIATTVGDFNAGMPALANAMESPSLGSVNASTPINGNRIPHPSFTTVNGTAGDNVPGYHTHTVPPRPAEDSIAVGTTEQEQPPLLLRKDGKPSKKQPTRNQPPRKKAA